MKNYYTDKPVLQYRKTTVEMGAVVAYLQSLPVQVEAKRGAYIMFRNEGANGKAGINNNYVGAQADSGRWPAKWDAHIAGTIIKNENGTGKQRIFLSFHRWEDSVDFLIDRVQSRGLFIGGHPTKYAKIDIAYPEELCLAYYREWVRGDEDYLPTEDQLKKFLSMYRQAEMIFK